MNGAAARALNAFVVAAGFVAVFVVVVVFAVVVVVVVVIVVVVAAAAIRKFVKCNAHKSKLALGRKEENSVAVLLINDISLFASVQHPKRTLVS